MNQKYTKSGPNPLKIMNHYHFGLNLAVYYYEVKLKWCPILFIVFERAHYWEFESVWDTPLTTWQSPTVSYHDNDFQNPASQYILDGLRIVLSRLLTGYQILCMAHQLYWKRPYKRILLGNREYVMPLEPLTYNDYA